MIDEEFKWIAASIAPLDEAGMQAARQRQACLTKPPGALGELETLAIRLAGMQANVSPCVEKIHICVFAADHGVAREGVSAFPQAVTAEMVKNFARGGAAICVAARQLSASFEIVNLGTVASTDDVDAVANINIAPGTQNFLEQAAMTPQQMAQAMDVGRRVVEQCHANGVNLFIGGEMGIGNTTSASAMACAFMQVAPARLAGPGTGLDSDGVAHKAKVIERALALHANSLQAPIDVLQTLGGFEIAALCAAYIRGAQLGLPMLVDGFIATSAALCACRINPEVSNWLLFSHGSAEPGHAALLECLQARPLLNLGLRLGEGSGAAVAVPLIKMACALHNEMATFEQAQVSEKL